jgi:hypothetical protein
MIITTPSSYWNGLDIAKVEKYYNAKYVCETTIKGSTGWLNSPVLIFYNEVPHPQGSNYMALFYAPISTDGKTALSVTDGISATTEEFVGVVADNGDIIYSRWRHDYRTSPDGSVWCDGGRDYFRGSGLNKTVYLKIIGSKLVEIPAENIDVEPDNVVNIPEA